MPASAAKSPSSDWVRPARASADTRSKHHWSRVSPDRKRIRQHKLRGRRRQPNRAGGRNQPKAVARRPEQSRPIHHHSKIHIHVLETSNGRGPSVLLGRAARPVVGAAQELDDLPLVPGFVVSPSNVSMASTILRDCTGDSLKESTWRQYPESGRPRRTASSTILPMMKSTAACVLIMSTHPFQRHAAAIIAPATAGTRLAVARCPRYAGDYSCHVHPRSS